ncbi:MAG: hypothetical protein AABY27_07035, partial [Pseudomonadota bacterium]
MSDKVIFDKLFSELKKTQEISNGSITMNNFDNLIRQLIDMLSTHLVNDERKEILYQLEMLLAQFTSLKRETAALSYEILRDNFLSDVIMDLRSIIAQTEKSVTKILDEADAIASLSQKVTDTKIREELMIKYTNILELCNFQDLTGQRTQKVINLLNEAESVIYKMLHILSPEADLISAPKQDLMNGPQDENNRPSLFAISNSGFGL